MLGAETNLGWQPSPQWRLTAGCLVVPLALPRAAAHLDDSGDGGDTVIESRDY